MHERSTDRLPREEHTRISPPHPRRPYSKPTCEAIPLVSKEVLAAGCKFVGGTGEFGSCHLGASCSAEGS